MLPDEIVIVCCKTSFTESASGDFVCQVEQVYLGCTLRHGTSLEFRPSVGNRVRYSLYYTVHAYDVLFLLL